MIILIANRPRIRDTKVVIEGSAEVTRAMEHEILASGEVSLTQVLFQSDSEVAASEVVVVLLESDEERSPLITLFEQIALDQSWQSASQLRAYPLSSVYFALQAGDELIGGLQLVAGNEVEGLPCLTVWPELGLHGKSGVADIALLALDKEHRGQRRLFWLLCIEMWRHCCRRNITTLWAEVTPAKLQLYRRLGWPLQIAGPLRNHWGELCYPCCMTTERVARAIGQKAVQSRQYRNLLKQAHRTEQI